MCCRVGGTVVAHFLDVAHEDASTDAGWVSPLNF